MIIIFVIIIIIIINNNIHFLYFTAKCDYRNTYFVFIINIKHLIC